MTDTRRDDVHGATPSDVVDSIEKAKKKLNVQKESDLCRYIPNSAGDGYVHHFTYEKVRDGDAPQFVGWVRRYILDPAQPIRLSPKKRALRGSRRGRGQVVLRKQDIDKMVRMARLAGDIEMVKMLTQIQDLKTLKRELIRQIRQNKVDHELWQSFVDAVTHSQLAQTGGVTTTSTTTPTTAGSFFTTPSMPVHAR